MADESSILGHYPRLPILTRLVSVLVSASTSAQWRVVLARFGTFCVRSIEFQRGTDLVFAIAPVLSSSQMRVVVVDTSVFVAALRSADGASRQVLRLALGGEIEPVMGQKLFLEFLDLFERPGIFDDCPVPDGDREALFEGFLSTCRWCEVFFLWRPNLPDEGDNHVMELAVAAGAGTVITHNVSDFRGELRFPGVEIFRPKDFLKQMR